MNKYKIFDRVALARDFPEKDLLQGDVATIVDEHPDPDGGEAGYSLEIFNALGETLTVIVVSESDLQPLNANEILNARSLSFSA